MDKRRLIGIIALCALIVLAVAFLPRTKKKDPPVTDTDTVAIEVDSLAFLDKDPEEGLMDALEYYGVHHAEIVYAQAKLESGMGNSSLYKRTNNLFGLYDSKNKRYFSYDHWSESVIGYKNKIQYKYQDGEDYYDFLERIHYATSPVYISTLKKVFANEQRKGFGRDTLPA